MLHFAFSLSLSFILSFIIIFVLFIFILYHRSIRIPGQYHLRTYSTKYSCTDIVKHYFKNKNISTITIVRDSKIHKLFFNLRKNAFRITYPPHLNKKRITGLDLDYILGRCYLTYCKYSKNRDISIMKWCLAILPIINFVCYWLIFLINITLIIILENNHGLLDQSNFLYHLIRFNILNILLIFCWALYLILLFVNYYLKIYLENNYHRDIVAFVKHNYLDLYRDFIIARNYSANIKFTFHLGIDWFFRYNYKFLGPFCVW